jgi:hypothetical protein
MTLGTKQMTLFGSHEPLGPEQMTLSGSHEPLGPETRPLSRSARALGALAAWLFRFVGARSPTDTSISTQHDIHVQPKTVQSQHQRKRRIVMATITATSKSPRRSTATLSLPRRVPALIVYTQGIVTRMTGNPSFPNPVPTVAAISTVLGELQSAETAALARTKGAVATRNEKRAALVSLLQQLRAHVQAMADADPANGPSLIQSAGMAVRKTATHHARVFAARQGAVSGEAKVVAATTARRAAYEWQYSTDGGKTWITTPTTLQAKTTVAGLLPGSTVQFKYRAVNKTGEGDWSQPVSLMVH